MTYRDFFDQIRDNLKDVDTEATASIPSAELGRYVLKGVRKIQTMFPEVRLDRRGKLCGIETVAYTETTADVQTGGEYPAIPLPEEFEPVLEAFVHVLLLRTRLQRREGRQPVPALAESFRPIDWRGGSEGVGR
jgi:hypothetical protein